MIRIIQLGIYLPTGGILKDKLEMFTVQVSMTEKLLQSGMKRKVIKCPFPKTCVNKDKGKLISKHKQVRDKKTFIPYV